MAQKRRSALEVASGHSKTDIWIDHAYLSESDIPSLRHIEKLTLWDVTFPDGFFSELTSLWWLDIRGSAQDNLSFLGETPRLRYFNLSHNRKIESLAMIARLGRLELLSLYALSKVRETPSLASLETLRRLQIGQMKSLKEIGRLVEAPNLTELELSKKVHVSEPDIRRLKKHPSLRYFRWFSDGVSFRTYQSVVGALNLPEAVPLHPWEWFENRG